MRTTSLNCAPAKWKENKEIVTVRTPQTDWTGLTTKIIKEGYDEPVQSMSGVHARFFFSSSFLLAWAIICIPVLLVNNGPCPRKNDWEEATSWEIILDRPWSSFPLSLLISMAGKGLCATHSHEVSPFSYSQILGAQDQITVRPLSCERRKVSPWPCVAYKFIWLAHIKRTET